MLPKGLLKEHSQALAMVIRILDVIAVLIAGIMAYWYKFGTVILSGYYAGALLSAASVTLVVFPWFQIYKSARTQRIWLHMAKLSQAVLVVLLLLAALAFLTKTGEVFSRLWFILWAIFSLGLLILFRCSMLVILRLMRRHGWNERQIILIGAGELGVELVEILQHSLWTGFRIVAIFDDYPKDKPSAIRGIPVSEMPSNIGAYLSNIKENIDEVWLALPLQAESRVKQILHELRHETITARLALDIFGMDLLNHSITHLGGLPILNVRETPMVGMNRMIKAVEDRLLACIILLFISPLFLLMAITIKFTSKGPVFYRQKRISWNGKEFEMLKFRTMPVDAESQTGPVWARKDEDRATKVGAILRKTSLDELPQFINVLFGDMSIVGPRPERIVFVDQFKDKIPRYMQKHLVKAGITGWAQVNGWRGNTSLEKRIEYDLYYIENWSLLLDFKIIFLTFFQGFINKNAY